MLLLLIVKPWLVAEIVPLVAGGITNLWSTYKQERDNYNGSYNFEFESVAIILASNTNIIEYGVR